MRLSCVAYTPDTHSTSKLHHWHAEVQLSPINFTEWISHLVGDQLAIGVWAYLLILISPALCICHDCLSSDVGFEIRKYRPPSFLLFQDYFGCFGSFSIQFEFLKKKNYRKCGLFFLFKDSLMCLKLA